jgi:hypothetical protein
LDRIYRLVFRPVVNLMKLCNTLTLAVLLILLIIAVPVSGAVICTSPAKCLTSQQAAEQFGAGNYVLTSRDVCGYLTDPTGARTAQYCYAPVASATLISPIAPVVTVLTTTAPVRMVPTTTQTTTGSGLIAPVVTTTVPTTLPTTVPVITTLTTMPVRAITTATQTPVQPENTTGSGFVPVENKNTGVIPTGVPTAGFTPMNNDANVSAPGHTAPAASQPDRGGFSGMYLIVGGLLGIVIIGGLAYYGLARRPGGLSGKDGFIDPASGGKIDPAGKGLGDGDGFTGPGGEGFGEGGGFTGPGSKGLGHGGGFDGPGGKGPGDGGDFTGPGGEGLGDGGGLGGLGGSLSGLTLPQARDTLIDLWMHNGSFSQGMCTDPLGTLENLGLKLGDEEKGIIKEINWSGLNEKRLEEGGDDGGGDGGGDGGDDGGNGGDDGGGDDGGDGGGEGGDGGGGGEGGDVGGGGQGNDGGLKDYFNQADKDQNLVTKLLELQKLGGGNSG